MMLAASTLIGWLNFGADGGRCRQFACGGIAQLGERLLCKQEVIGSIPFASTKHAIVCKSG